MILGAFYVRSQNSNINASLGPVVAVAPERSYIEATDTDKDGLPDWKEDLGIDRFKPITTSSSTLVGASSTEYTPPTTLTGKFAVAFLEDFFEKDLKNASPEEKEAFVASAVSAVNSHVTNRVYTRSDISIIENSPDAFRTYGNSIVSVITSVQVKRENELLILRRALESKDPKILASLDPLKDGYAKMITELLKVPAPELFIASHTELLTSFDAIRSDIEAMQKVFEDPLYAIAYTKRYEDDVKRMVEILKNMNTTFRAEDVIFEKDEPGALFYLLNL